jgi:hypothetical protein
VGGMAANMPHSLLEPGGIVLDDVERSPFSVFGAEDESNSIKKHVDVFNKLIRRYKYLQRPFEETLKNILQFINKWQADENSKLAKATGYFITTQLANPVVFKVLLKDYLVKDGKWDSIGWVPVNGIHDS